MARRPPLHVWLYDTHVAELTSNKPGQVVCRYTAEAHERWDLNTALLSCSLPLTARPHTMAAPYFRGLLPEGAALHELAAAARVPTFDTYGMLAHFGRDVAGAVLIADAAWEPRNARIEPYDDAGLFHEVAGLHEHPLALHDDSELSIAGLQDKLLLVRTADGWARPVAGYPSTHILKLEDRRFPGLVTMENAALRLAHHLELTNVESRTATIGGFDCLIVSRFDRIPPATPGGPSVRLHQEDSCQALGIDADAARGRAKYETEGGPSFADIAALLDTFALDANRQLQRLLEVAAFTVAIGNADAHGKNVSLLHTAPGVVELAPLYDTVPTALWPGLRREAAMRVNGRATLDEVTLADLADEARHWRLDRSRAEHIIRDLLERLVSYATDADLPAPFAELVRRRATALATGRPASAD